MILGECIQQPFPRNSLVKDHSENIIRGGLGLLTGCPDLAIHQRGFANLPGGCPNMAKYYLSKNLK